MQAKCCPRAQVAAQEAMGAEQTVVAKQALLQLWDLVEKDSNGTFQPGDQAVIMSNLVKITQDNQAGNDELRYAPLARQSCRPQRPAGMQAQSADVVVQMYPCTWTS